MTIHNIGYQGVFNKNEIFWTQLGWGAYTEDNLKFFDDINFLKSSLLWSDAVTTVSRKYAEEIQTREFGYDLSGILQMRKDRLFGITNGIDYDDWNPETDKHIKASYDINNISGKSICKEDLQKTMGLPVKNNVPLFASITRVTHQKGMDILSYSLGRFLSHYDAQFVLLGSGDESILSIYDYLKNIFPDKVAIYKGYNGDLSHKIEAGADIFIMPSRYEPCGLNQMYSLKYGTVPIVRATGGLDDTVEEWNSTEKTGSGFKFIHLNEWDLEQTIIKAADAYHNSEDWKIIQQNGMSYTNSWDDAADEYIKLYHNVTKF